MFGDPAGNIIGVWQQATIVTKWSRSVFTDAKRPGPVARTMAS